MVNGHNTHHSKGAQKYINPLTVPTKKKVQIYEDDPRNNESTINQSSVVFEIIPDDIDADSFEVEDIYEDYFGEGYDPDVIMEEDPDPVIPIPSDLMTAENIETLGVPENLYIDPTSYQIEDYGTSSDGMVRWVASLVFDDVSNAASYEYTINASE